MLVCSLMIIAVMPVMAQNAKPANMEEAAIADYPKRLLKSKAEEIGAYASRNVETLTKQSLKQAREFMEQEIATTKDRINKATVSTEKARLQKIYSTQNEIFATVKTLAADVMKNAVSIKKELNRFAETM